MAWQRSSFKQAQKVVESMRNECNGFFHLMCKEKQTDEIVYLEYSESKLAAILEHASVDVVCYNSYLKRTYAFECKYVSKKTAPNVTFELSHQNGKDGWALDDCTMNKDIVFFLKGIGAVLCDMKVFQNAVKRNLESFDTKEFNDSKIVQVHYSWLIGEAGGLFYPEEKLLHADAVQKDLLMNRFIKTIKEVGANVYKYSMEGLLRAVWSN